MPIRTLLAAALAAGALATASPASANCHGDICTHHLPTCAEPVCDTLAELLGGGGSATDPASDAGTLDLGHTLCVLVRDNTGINMACEG